MDHVDERNRVAHARQRLVVAAADFHRVLDFRVREEEEVADVLLGAGGEGENLLRRAVDELALGVVLVVDQKLGDWPGRVRIGSPDTNKR